MGAETSNIAAQVVPRRGRAAPETETIGGMGRTMPVGHMPEPHITWDEVTFLFADNKAATTKTNNDGSMGESTNKGAPPIPKEVLQELYRGEGDRYGKPLAIPGCVIFEKNSEATRDKNPQSAGHRVTHLDAIEWRAEAAEPKHTTHTANTHQLMASGQQDHGVDDPSIARSAEEQDGVEQAVIEPQGEASIEQDTKRDEVEGYSDHTCVSRDPYDSRLLDEEHDSDEGQIGRDREDESGQSEDGGHGTWEDRDSVDDVSGPSIDRHDDDKSSDQHCNPDIATGDGSSQTGVAPTASETRTTTYAGHQSALRPTSSVAPKMISRESAARSKAESLARKAKREAATKKEREAQKLAKRAK